MKSLRALRCGQRSAIIEMCNRAYEEDLAPLFDTFGTATHVLGYCDQVLVSHAIWVTRWLQPGTLPLLRTAYIEMVATASEYRKRGFASAVMKRVEREIQGFDIGALSPFSVAYYARLGWERWRGPLFIWTEDGLVPTPDDEVVMILRLPRTPEVDLDAPLSAEWCEGRFGVTKDDYESEHTSRTK